ncbi:MAG: DUF2961 domain-containing protein [Bacteroidetes bacterium]|nr:MAG: DUF2961 domain-containing protein [Bacteroidota bacterium]
MRPTLIFALLIISNTIIGQDWYRFPQNAQSKVVSFENPTGEPGKGGIENMTAKGHPAEVVKAGEQKILLDYKGAGTITRIWCTINERSPAMLRSIRIQFYWDGASKPAVDVPLGDFFGVGLGQKVKFQTTIFSDPEGRSFNCSIPMPFRKSAKIVFINEGKAAELLFYDIDLLKVDQQPQDMLYFHSYWSREIRGSLKKDFEILPKISGKGRFLGTNIGVIADSAYGDTWWGEGEVKMYIDGDSKFPTINGTGTEDYIGTGWGMGVFNHMNQGCLVADEQKKYYAFYRYHIPDAIYFHSGIRVDIQQIGGGMRDQVRTLLSKGVELEPVTVSGENHLFWKLYEMNPVPKVTDENFPNGWVNFYRLDDYSATAYFYLDKPSSDLPPLAAAEKRADRLK